MLLPRTLGLANIESPVVKFRSIESPKYVIHRSSPIHDSELRNLSFHQIILYRFVKDGKEFCPNDQGLQCPYTARYLTSRRQFRKSYLKFRVKVNINIHCHCSIPVREVPRYWHHQSAKIRSMTTVSLSPWKNCDELFFMLFKLT